MEHGDDGGCEGAHAILGIIMVRIRLLGLNEVSIHNQARALQLRKAPHPAGARGVRPAAGEGMTVGL